VKRRLYDVTTVLESVGLIKKCQRGKLTWNFQPSKTDRRF